jgi:hypothetical protein
MILADGAVQERHTADVVASQASANVKRVIACNVTKGCWFVSCVVFVPCTPVDIAHMETCLLPTLPLS